MVMVAVWVGVGYARHQRVAECTFKFPVASSKDAGIENDLTAFDARVSQRRFKHKGK